jgi:hypothetical protein
VEETVVELLDQLEVVAGKTAAEERVGRPVAALAVVAIILRGGGPHSDCWVYELEVEVEVVIASAFFFLEFLAALLGDVSKSSLVSYPM